MPKCSDCGIERQQLSSHHIIPRCQGGTDDQENLVLICANCHEDRHDGFFGGTLRGYNSLTPESRKKHSIKMKALWQDPEHRAKMMESRKKKREERAAQGNPQPPPPSSLPGFWTDERKSTQSQKMREIRSKKHWSSRTQNKT